MRKLLLLDVDGVMTDGTKIYSPNGYVSGKRFCDRDFTAIKKFKMENWFVIWLSGDTVVNKTVAANREIEFWSAFVEDKIDKIAVFNNIIMQYNISVNNVIYVGDDLFDIPLMQVINDGGGMTFCPADAAKHVKNVAKHTTLAGGGSGVIMEILDFYGLDNVSPCS